MAELGMTEQRRKILEQVRDKRVTYDKSAAAWWIDGHSVAGWTGRTLSELRRSEYILVIPSEAVDELSTVDLTDVGRHALSD